MNQKGENVKCVWFMIDNRSRTQSFPAASLMAVETVNP
ncbi:hypothetical protein ACDI13_03260 [Alcaligenes faecalis]